MFASRSLRALGLAAALAAPLLAGVAHAETGASPFGTSASAAWQANGRTPLAATSQANAAQILLERSGATGGGGQHG